MAITQVANPSSVPSAVADYEAQNAHISAFNNIVNNQPFILTNSGGTGLPAIKLGTYIQFGGNLYVVDTEDYAILGTPVDGNNYIRLSGSTTLTAEWVQDISSYVWNEVYGYKYTGSYALLPYLVVKDGTEYAKYTNFPVYPSFTDQDLKTTDSPTFASVNTGQGANELYAMNQNVRTTDAVTFSSVNTGHGANELYPMNQAVRTTDSPTFAKLKLTTSTYGSQSIAADASWVVPAGIYMFRFAASVTVEIWDGSAWVGIGSGSALISDGSNLRVRNDYSQTQSIRYRKFS